MACSPGLPAARAGWAVHVGARQHAHEYVLPPPPPCRSSRRNCTSPPGCTVPRPSTSLSWTGWSPMQRPRQTPPPRARRRGWARGRGAATAAARRRRPRPSVPSPRCAACRGPLPIYCLYTAYTLPIMPTAYCLCCLYTGSCHVAWPRRVSTLPAWHAPAPAPARCWPLSEQCASNPLTVPEQQLNRRPVSAASPRCQHAAAGLPGARPEVWQQAERAVRRRRVAPRCVRCAMWPHLCGHPPSGQP